MQTFDMWEKLVQMLLRQGQQCLLVTLLIPYCTASMLEVSDHMGDPDVCVTE